MSTHLSSVHSPKLDETGVAAEVTIQPPDLQRLLVSHRGNVTFEQALSRISNGSALLKTLSSYVYFNSIFACGVVHLTGAIGSRQYLFRDTNEEVTVAADRSIEVAAPIFFASIDEFGGRGPLVGRSTHRTLAQATVKAIGRFFGYDVARLNEITAPTESTLLAVRRVRNGYAMNAEVADEKVFQAIGFHIGSEILADQEFNILDRFLSDRYADLTDQLKHERVRVNSAEVSPYRWIQIHTVVEADHFDAALVGANLALRDYAGPADRAQVKEWILMGFSEFATMQAEFMEGLMK